MGEIDVFTLQDNYAGSVEPTESTTFSLYGLTGYEVQYWDGADLDEVKKQLAQMLGTDDDAKQIKFDEKTNTITVDLTGIDLTKNERASLLNDAVGMRHPHVQYVRSSER